MLLQSDYRMNWEEEEDSFSSSLSLSDSFKKAFTGIAKSMPELAIFDPSTLMAGPSVSFESLTADSFPVHEDQLFFTIDPDASILEFNENGHLMDETAPNKAPKNAAPADAYYGGDLYLSWEDDIFAGALSISELPVPSAPVAASPALPTSPTFIESVEVVDTLTSTPSPSRKTKSKSNTPSRKRSTPSVGPSPKTPKAPRSSLKDLSSSPKRQRRHSSKNYVTFALEPQVLSFPLDRDERVSPSPKAKKIGLLSSSTHQLSDSTIRNIFRAEQVVTLCKAECDDDEDVDIL